MMRGRELNRFSPVSPEPIIWDMEPVEVRPRPIKKTHMVFVIKKFPFPGLCTNSPFAQKVGEKLDFMCKPGFRHSLREPWRDFIINRISVL